LQYRTNSHGQAYPLDNKSLLKWDSNSQKFNMFNNNKNESDNQKRKHLEKFAKSTKGKITGIHSKIQRKNQERIAKNEAEFKEINIRIKNIISSDEPNNMKIQNLQRLLNDKSKKMDKPMLQTVKNELTKLHEIEGTSQDITEPENDDTSQDITEPENEDNNESQNNKKHMTPSEVFSQGL
jgi:hypothetical protein